MNPNSRYEEAHIRLQLKQAHANFRQAAKERQQVRKSQAERHIWALKGLFKSVTKNDPPRTESESSLSGMEDESEEQNNEAARVFMKVQLQGKALGQKRKRNGNESSNKRKRASTESYSRPVKVTKVVSQDEKENQSDGSSDSSQSKSESEEEDDEAEEVVTSGRNKFSCPLRCGSKPVYQLPRHLTKVHGWDKGRARNAVNHCVMATRHNFEPLVVTRQN